MSNYNYQENMEKKEGEKEEKIPPKTVQYYVKASFTITYILLITTGTITFIEALRTKIPEVRHVLNLETCISIIAGYFYSNFIKEIDAFSKHYKPIDWEYITKTRYIDWTITTPLMLLTLSIVLSYNLGKKVSVFIILPIIILNYSMLYIGYLGETKVLDRWTASFLGFIPFIGMFYILFKNYLKPKYVFANYLFYSIYLVVWGLYGIVYLFNDEYKNIMMNVLDCIAKCLVGLALWLYYSKIITF